MAALGGRLEVQAVFDDVDLTVPLLIGGDIGPAAESRPSLSSATAMPGASAAVKKLASSQGSSVDESSDENHLGGRADCADLVAHSHQRPGRCWYCGEATLRADARLSM